VVLLHADAVAEDGAAADAAGGVDGEDGEGLALAAERGGEGVDQRFCRLPVRR
jgi:hypothetical protein